MKVGLPNYAVICIQFCMRRSLRGFSAVTFDFYENSVTFLAAILCFCYIVKHRIFISKTTGNYSVLIMNKTKHRSLEC
jgi:hypothetical protein